MLNTTRLFRGSPKSVSVSSHSGSQSSTLCARILQEPGVYTSTFDLSEASPKESSEEISFASVLRTLV